MQEPLAARVKEYVLSARYARPLIYHRELYYKENAARG
jgi:hypothetical protein